MTQAMTTATGGRSVRREATRQRVIDAAREVFAERGVFGGTVEDICERAGFTRGAFYSNFADKADVLEALVEREHDRLLEQLDANFGLVDELGDDAGAPEAWMGAIVERFLGAVPVDRRYWLIQAELELLAIRDPEGSRRFREAEARFRERIREYLVRGMARLGREFTAEPTAVTDAVIAIVEGTAYRALALGRDDPSAIARVMLPVLLAGTSRRPADRRRGGG